MFYAGTWFKRCSSGIVACLLFLFCADAKAQTAVNVADVNALSTRFTKGSDTTYVLNFWATWCGPCRKELPQFETLNKQSAGKKIKVILISLDDYPRAAAKVAQFVKANKLTAEVLLLKDPAQKLVSKYVSNKWEGALPATLIIPPNNTAPKFINGLVEGKVFEELAR